MKNFFIVSLLALIPVVGNAAESQVVCGYKLTGGTPVAEVSLNKRIEQAVKQGFTEVSAPSVSSVDVICVTVSKPDPSKACK